MAYWTYENWRAKGHRATVHRADCGHCNEGQGTGRGEEGRNGRWHGPFATGAGAARAGTESGAAVSSCGSCAPEISQD